MNEGRAGNEHYASLNERRGAAGTALALEEAPTGRAIAQLTSDKAWAMLGRKTQVSQQKKMPGNRTRGCLMRAVTRVPRNVACQTDNAVHHTEGRGEEPQSESQTSAWKAGVLNVKSRPLSWSEQWPHWARAESFGAVEYLFIHSRYGEQGRTLWVEKSRGQAAGRTLPSCVLLTVWKSTVSSLLMSSTRMVDLLWVIFPMSFHLGKTKATVLAPTQPMRLWILAGGSLADFIKDDLGIFSKTNCSFCQGRKDRKCNTNLLK